MTDHLTAELRAALDDLDDARGDRAYVRIRRLAEQVEALADRVEQVATEPAELEAVPAGLDPEQEIRARALAAAVEVCDRATMPDDFVVRDYEVLVVGTADRLAAWIRDGSQPA